MLLVCIFVWAPFALAQDQVENLRLWHSPDKTRIVLDLSGATPYKIFSLESPNRLVIDLQNISVNSKADAVKVNSKLIRGWRHARQNKHDVRLVFDLRYKLKMEHFALAPQQPYGHRIVLDLFTPPSLVPEDDPIASIIAKQQAKVVDKTAQAAPRKPEERASITESLQRATQNSANLNIASRDVIVAIDAGHGGEDPGAIGSGRTKEKTVVLQIAKRVAAELEKQRGVTAVQTRKGDYFVELAERVRLSHQKYHADIFISIHADAAQSRSVRGASVYVLGKKGMDRTLSLYLAEQEQLGNALGSNKQDSAQSLNKVLADLSLEGSMSHSVLAAQPVIQSLASVASMHASKVKSNNFQVLRNPYMPALLVETGFISNRQDEILLQNSQHQQKLAKAIGAGVLEYLRDHPPPGSYFAALRDNPIVEYTVKSGDALSMLAQKYKTSVAVIRKTNSLKSSKIRVGQVLKIQRGAQ